MQQTFFFLKKVYSNKYFGFLYFLDHGYWQALHVDGNVPPARTAHAAMVDSRGRMWIVGGETFSYSHHLDMVATFSPDLINKDVQGIWATVHAKGEKGPSPRYGHSAVIHEDKVGKLEGTQSGIFLRQSKCYFL